MDIRIENEIGRRIPRQHVLTRMAQALRRVLVQPASARVAFTDVNGPKGGADVRCTVLVSLPGQPPISITRAGTTPRLAFDASYDRATRQLERGRARWQDSRRHPKKYYVAKRLLTSFALVLGLVVLPFAAFGQGVTPSTDLELKAKRKTTVVTPKATPAQAAKDAEEVRDKTEGARRVGEATKREPPSRPDGDVTGGIQSKGIKGELSK